MSTWLDSEMPRDEGSNYLGFIYGAVSRDNHHGGQEIGGKDPPWLCLVLTNRLAAGREWKGKRKCLKAGLYFSGCASCYCHCHGHQSVDFSAFQWGTQLPRLILGLRVWTGPASLIPLFQQLSAAWTEKLLDLLPLQYADSCYGLSCLWFCKLI